jgi:hypothetical protein
MKKKISIIVIGIIAIILLIPVFLKSTFLIERSIVISKPANVIFQTVSDYHTWKNWSVWSLQDPLQTISILGKPGEIGHSQEWDGKVNGKGKQTISALVKDKELTFDLEFLDPNPMKSIAKFTFEPVEGGTKVTWSTSGESEYPVGRYFGLFLDGLIGPDFEAGLNNLKNILEKN